MRSAFLLIMLTSMTEQQAVAARNLARITDQTIAITFSSALITPGDKPPVQVTDGSPDQ
ncbi:hypothetical protein I0P70_12505 [Pontibacter sp. FD36]|uniref:hypothetical protein n=1 Tax=Pontibacter sp. FD36 TaxID=2789860 RepID=UPI0018AA3F58|nr:hypothetical protein [Pontibacter sp. FD36]MBF8964069.1 hypothetical protein [Pontibacter sp. FD36]